MNHSIGGVVDFLRQNESLIREIQETANAGANIIESFANRLEEKREETKALLEQINSIQFSIAADLDVKKQQAMLLNEINEVSKKIQKFKNFPSVTTHLHAQRSALYLELGNTYNNLVSQFVTFTQDEVDQLQELLRRATLDTESRQRLASILDAAVNISKFALRVALKFT